MQFARVNPRSDLALTMPIKPPVKQNARPKPQHPPKSSPPDAEDLRRRLHIVLSEQNAQREARRLRAQRTNNDGAMGPPSTGPAAPGSDVDATVTSVYTRKSATTSFAARAATASTTAGTAAPAALRVVIAPPRADANRASHGSINQSQDLRRADSKMDAAGAAKDVKRSKSSSSSKAKKPATAANVANEEQPQPAEPYHHVPQVAAQQFARTATANASLGDMSNVHPLSRQALKFHIEGSAAERMELDSSKTPGEQKRALRRAQSTREKLQERNQFQSDAPPAAVATAIPSRNKRHSLPANGFAVSPTSSMLSSSLPDGRNNHNHNHWNWANMGDIVEDSPLRTNDDNYHYQSGEFSPSNTTNNGSHGRRRRSFNFADLMPSCRPVNADGEPLVLLNPAAAAARRVDWAQKDEKDENVSQQQQNSHSKVPRSPLLRKADSLWALKGKLVSVSTGRKHQHQDNSSSKTSRNSAHSSETGMTSPIKSPSRGGFFARLRRLS